ncbi:NADPH-dependent FMN reductase [Marinitenerispora sediminis]|uniref:NADPH-dependent oxidoreductase n=1 Tax=Marinitenerispora sediminis TaxID=1931232 RepID=A0A368T8R9_9ACTN|nr:NADPH-dependent FMN reductase [Marinitenerispora sediminis]RCV52081.1 NADPH-dependent oxidoreductase [Marinitenerispora sediminis]RCV58100.1 NADPH-dependent oxidoreductase [Marinitenerispora sediminis]RCV60838.1 NADPH-dependent oxidoreductase [Marinitenerispora sediminis]
MATAVPNIVFLSGSLSRGSRADRIAGWSADRCVLMGAAATVFTGAQLEFPIYRPGHPDRGPEQHRYLAALAEADGVVLVSPAYHGTVSGLLKNALDFVNDLADAPRPFLDGRGVGCVSVALGEQGAGTTLSTLRTVAHALRGWPTPLGVALAGARAGLDDDGRPVEPAAAGQLEAMLGQVMTMARLSARRRQRVLDRAAAS